MIPSDNASATFPTSTPHAATDERSHPISAGQTVTVISGSPPFIEGRAVIVDAAPGRHRYRLQFLDETRTQERVVHPAHQDDPERALAWLLELWRASIEPPLFEEFFPDDIETNGA
jgi:hypothetical protein